MASLANMVLHSAGNELRGMIPNISNNCKSWIARTMTVIQLYTIQNSILRQLELNEWELMYTLLPQSIFANICSLCSSSSLAACNNEQALCDHINRATT